jgi:hypothetical protein
VITFNLVGGSTGISFSSSRVEVLWATANPGFVVEVDADIYEAEVVFESDEHESIVKAKWDDGPRHEVREKAS